MRVSVCFRTMRWRQVCGRLLKHNTTSLRFSKQHVCMVGFTCGCCCSLAERLLHGAAAYTRLQSQPTNLHGAVCVGACSYRRLLMWLPHGTAADVSTAALKAQMYLCKYDNPYTWKTPCKQVREQGLLRGALLDDLWYNGHHQPDTSN